MNLLVLVAGLRVWKCPPLSTLSRLLAAIAMLCVEMQAITWLHLGSLRSLLVLNAIVAVVLYVWARPRDPSRLSLRGLAHTLPVPALGLLLVVTLFLNVSLPLEGADPYHLQRVEQIERLGTLEYDPAADIKVNVLASVYELVLADVRQIPVVGRALVRVHGVLGLGIFALTVAAVREWLTAGPRWVWMSVFALPVLFHQLVLVKNDLFGAIPGFVALCWLVARARTASTLEIVWASALAGFALAIKMVSFPLALVLGAVVGIERRPSPDTHAMGSRWQPLAWVLLGGIAGAVAGGLLFTLIQTTKWYGHPFEPLAALGNRNTSLGESLTSVGRFSISLVDFGATARVWWPGRGGWGATFGAPVIWAIGVLIARASSRREARLALAIAAAYFLVFAVVYPDADIAHRLVLAPGLMLTAVAAHLADGADRQSVWLRRALVLALVLSALQISRSAFLYVVRGS